MVAPGARALSLYDMLVARCLFGFIANTISMFDFLANELLCVDCLWFGLTAARVLIFLYESAIPIVGGLSDNDLDGLEGLYLQVHGLSSDLGKLFKPVEDLLDKLDRKDCSIETNMQVVHMLAQMAKTAGLGLGAVGFNVDIGASTADLGGVLDIISAGNNILGDTLLEKAHKEVCTHLKQRKQRRR